ncbi:glycosyltransferase [Candidatus Saccharibacteria bacterium]|nr:glycosyltransferase [Candidatus Saccharibacteria bacterium]
MNDEPLISIIVSVYNISNYVPKCLDSINEQTYSNLEVIVVDDGSTDDSGKICDEFGKRDHRFKVFHKKNGGLSSARNFGIEKAKGEMVALIDGDDYIDAGFIKAMYLAMKADEADIAVCGYNNLSPKREVLSGKMATAKLLVGQENIDIIACNKLYKKELFKKNNIEYPVGCKYEDSLTTYKIMVAAKKITYVPRSLYNYVKRDDSIMGQADNLERLKARERAAEEAVDYFAGDEFLKQAAEVAVLTAKYAFMDAAAHGEIGKGHFEINAEWINKNLAKYKKNRLMTKKLKLYNSLNHVKLYRFFRTIV